MTSLSGGSSRKRVSRWVRRLAVGLACTAGLAAGFWLGMTSDDSTEFTVAVDKELRFGRSNMVSAILDKGWSDREVWGMWMAQPKASLVVGFDGAAAGDIELLIEARVRRGEEGDKSGIIVRYNETEVGRWRLSTKAYQLRRRFIVPEAVFNRNTAAGALSFEAIGETRPEFGLESISLRDARRLMDFKGFVDKCRPDRIVGWAVGGDTPVTVVVRVGDAPMPAIFSNVNRPDLQVLGLPLDAGFELLLAKPIAVGSTIEVRFPNGRHLNGSPCRF